MIIVLCLFYSCHQTKKEKAQKLVTDYLKTSLNDPSSYESISFDTLRTSYEDYEAGNPDGRKLSDKSIMFLDSIAKYQKLSQDETEKPLHNQITNDKNYFYYTHRDSVFSKKEDSIDKIIKIQGENFKGRIVGYGINHMYRAKNGFGAVMIYNTDFWIDSTLTKVINAQAAR
jgi:hypothetical protein